MLDDLQLKWFQITPQNPEAETEHQHVFMLKKLKGDLIKNFFVRGFSFWDNEVMKYDVASFNNANANAKMMHTI